MQKSSFEESWYEVVLQKLVEDLRVRNFRRMKFSMNGIFAEWNFRRTEISPSEISLNGIFAEHYTMMTSEVNFQINIAYINVG